MSTAPHYEIPPIVVPTITPGTFVRMRREALGLTREQVALMLETEPCVSNWRRAEWLAAIEADLAPISLGTALALHDTIALNLRVLAYWMAIAEGARPSLVDVLLAEGVELPIGAGHAA